MCMFGYKLIFLYLYILKLNYVIKLKFYMNIRIIELNLFDFWLNELVFICQKEKYKISRLFDKGYDINK